MNRIQELQWWYRSHCNGDWEHGYGVKIETLDNPGWKVTIDLAETDCTDLPFSEMEKLGHETDWIHCRVRDQRFEGVGGPLMLEEMLRVFLDWVQRPTE